MQLHREVEKDRLESVLEEFTGEIYQLPPVKASVKRALRKRRIYYIKLLEAEGRLILFKVACQAGTYVRKLCSDIGDALGVGAHMRELRRIRAGPFHVDENLTTMLELRNAWESYLDGDEAPLRKVVMPVEYMFKHTPKIYIRDSAVDAVCHGASLAVPGVAKLDLEVKPGTLTGIFTLKGEVVALAEASMSTDEILDKERGIAAKVKRVIMPLGTYPKKWRSRPG